MLCREEDFWRYDLPKELIAELTRKTDCQETCTITINLLELLGMVVTAWVMLELVGDRPGLEGGPILMRGDNRHVYRELRDAEVRETKRRFY